MFLYLRYFPSLLHCYLSHNHPNSLTNPMVYNAYHTSNFSIPNAMIDPPSDMTMAEKVYFHSSLSYRYLSSSFPPHYKDERDGSSGTVTISPMWSTGILRLI